MKLTTILVAAAAFAALASPAFADGTHAGGHDDYALGSKGKKAKATRTINITMMEDGDGNMVFEPKNLTFKEGETAILKFTNKGELDHEFVMDSEDKVIEHKALMEKFPEMEHEDDNSLRLAPGEKGEIVWTFSKSGKFAFACLIPGHYEAGMHGPLHVAKN
jgi:uncharacterized cupredoxin-like copper-binding protein